MGEKNVCVICKEDVMRRVGTERKVIDVEKEEKRTQDRTLGYTTCDVGRRR